MAGKESGYKPLTSEEREAAFASVFKPLPKEAHSTLPPRPALTKDAALEIINRKSQQVHTRESIEAETRIMNYMTIDEMKAKIDGLLTKK